MAKKDMAAPDHEFDAQYTKSALYKAYLEHMNGNGDAGESRYSDPEVGHTEIMPKNENKFVAPDNKKGSKSAPEKEHGANDPLAKKVAKGTDKNQGHSSKNMSVLVEPIMSPFQKKIAKFHTGSKKK